MGTDIHLFESDEIKAKAQGYYETARAQILAQGGKAILNGLCSYRLKDEDGIKKCAVGAIIPDEHYDSSGECAMGDVVVAFDGTWAGCGVHTANTDPRVLARMLNASGIPATYAMRDFLSQMQRAHDAAHNKTAQQIVAEFDIVAERFQLKVVMP